MEKTLFTEALLSALIRKQPKDILAVLLEIDGKPEVAEEVRAAGRFTKALVDRSVKLETTEPVEEEKFEEPLPEFAEAAVEDNELLAIHTDIENLLAKGKGKKALKLIKASMANGTKGSVIKEQLAKAKQLKKEAK